MDAPCREFAERPAQECDRDPASTMRGEDREPVDPASLVVAACGEGADGRSAIPRQEPERRVVCSGCSYAPRATGRTGSTGPLGSLMNAASRIAWTGRRSSDVERAPISIPSGAGPGSSGPSRSICMCQKWRTGRRPWALAIAAAASSRALIECRKRGDSTPAMSVAARASMRSNKAGPMPLSTVLGMDDAPRPDEVRLLPPRLPVGDDRSGAVDHHPGIVSKVEVGPAPHLAEKERVDRGLDAVGSLVGEEHVSHGVDVVLRRRPKRVAVGEVHTESVPRANPLCIDQRSGAIAGYASEVGPSSARSIANREGSGRTSGSAPAMMASLIRILAARGDPVRPLEIGLALPMGDSFVDGSTARWVDTRAIALRAEELGFDTLWTADELLWHPAEAQPQGWWEGVAMTSAVAAVTSRVKVGSWVFSTLHRNPGITAKAAETIDEISGGRFVFGLGSGHAGRQAHAFGLPEDYVYSRFEEAHRDHHPAPATGSGGLRGHVPCRARPGTPAGRASAGPDPDRHRREGTQDAPSGRPPRGHVELVRRGAERPYRVGAPPGRARGCLRRGRSRSRDDREVGGHRGRADLRQVARRRRSGIPIRGSSEEIADAMRAFGTAGFTSLEVMLWPPTMAAVDAMAPVIELLDAD